MIELSIIKENPARSTQLLESRFVANAAQQISDILSLDEKRRSVIVSLEQLKREMNQTSKSIGQLMKSGKKEEAEQAKSQTASLKSNIKQQENELQSIETALQDILVTLPNLPHESVPKGKSSDDNVVYTSNDIKVNFDFDALPHWELARKHDIIDWDLGSKITGAGFPVYKGKGASLQRALINFFLDQAREAGYTEIQPPLVVNEASGFATGQLPDKEGQMYHVAVDDLYLIPTAEVPITNLYRDEIIDHAALPIKNCGYTPCFRREAGSYGKEVKGLNRLHQFDKVELVQVVHPDTSYETLEEMTAYVSGLLEALGFPYRRLLLCTGDATFASAKTYDLEVYSAGQQRWLEVSSVSNFETFQSNRLKLRFRDDQKKKQLAHTLNGSALALPRIMASLIENYQQADGSISIPEVLRTYTRFDQIG